MTPEEKKAYIIELAKRGYDKAARVEGLFDELAVKSAKLRVELRGFKEGLSEELAKKNAKA